MAGTLKDTVGLLTAMHIFTADKGDYYALHEAVPWHAQDAGLHDDSVSADAADG